MCMVTDNIGLVHYVVRRYYSDSINTQYYDDLVQIGCIGLIKASKKFDASKGFKFATYAVPMIYGEINKHQRDNSSFVHVCREDALRLLKIRAAIKKYGNDDMETISKATNIPLNDLIKLNNEASAALSLDYTTVNGNRERSFSEIVIDNMDVEKQVINRLTLEEELNKLSDIERKVFVLYHFLDAPQPKIAKIVGLSQAQVSRILKKICKGSVRNRRRKAV